MVNKEFSLPSCDFSVSSIGQTGRAPKCKTAEHQNYISKTKQLKDLQKAVTGEITTFKFSDASKFAKGGE